MTKEELEAEVRFRLCKSVFTTLYREQQVSYEQLQTLLYAAAEKLEAPIGRLEVNSIAGEKGYTGLSSRNGKKTVQANQGGAWWHMPGYQR